VLSPLANRDRASRRCVNSQIPYIEHSMQQMDKNREYKNRREQPASADGSAWNQQKDGADDLAPSQNLPENIWHVSSREIVAGSWHHKQNRFNQNHKSESPLQCSDGAFQPMFVHFVFGSLGPRYFSAVRLRAGRALISFNRWLALESRSKS
jgi:hypothetical protein